jgi:hypothetical protein
MSEQVYRNATIRTCGRCGYQSNVIGDLERHKREAHPRRASSIPLILRAKLDKPSCRNCGKQLTDEGNDSACALYVLTRIRSHDII